jgi:glutamate synthase domain-containing protein 2
VIALGAGGLAIGTGPLVVIGLLPEVARDLQVTIPEAGHIIKACALGVATQPASCCEAHESSGTGSGRAASSSDMRPRKTERPDLQDRSSG